VTPQEALAFVRRQRVVPFTDTKGAPESFVHAVTGEAVKGSWWGHPRGHEIFNLAGAVGAEAITVKLVAGKETLLHRSLFPALARVVLDPEWRGPRISALSKDARRLLDLVESSESVRLDEAAARFEVKTSALAEKRRELQRALLVHVDEEHTEKGYHVAVLVPWRRWATREVARSPKELSLEDALRELREACRGAKTALDGLS
jgi:hypothetical protein